MLILKYNRLWNLTFSEGILKDIILLGIESSCDETAAAVVMNGRKVLSNIISTQFYLHAEDGVVVP